MERNNIEYLSEEGAKHYLFMLIQALDELDNDDFFGTEGWRHFLKMED